MSVNDVLKQKVAYLYEKQQISYQAKLYAYSLIQPDLDWPKWIIRFTMTIGTAFFLIGVIFFFAYNWTSLTDFQKFATVEVGMLVSLMGYLFAPQQHLVSKLFLMSLSVLVGVFLAVFGQIYQTGADTYELFLMWSFLITGFVLLSCYQGLWFLWSLLIHVGLFLWLKTYESFFLNEEFFCWLSYLSVLTITFLLCREFARAKKIEWLQGNWPRYAFLVMLLGLQVPGAIIFFYQNGHVLWVSFFIYVFSCGGLSFVFQRMIKDIQSISLILFSAFIVTEALLFRFLTKAFDYGNEAAWLFMGMGTIAIIMLMVKLLRLAKKDMGVHS